MPKTAFQTAALSCLIVAGLASARAEPVDPTAGLTSDLTWEVTNPFRFYKHDKSFAAHEAAFKAVRGMASVPSDIIQRIERCRNDPDPADGSAAACDNLAR